MTVFNEEETYLVLVDEDGDTLQITDNRTGDKKFDDLYIGIEQTNSGWDITRASVALSPEQVDDLIASLTKWKYLRAFASQPREDD